MKIVDKLEWVVKVILGIALTLCLLFNGCEERPMPTYHEFHTCGNVYVIGMDVDGVVLADTSGIISHHKTNFEAIKALEQIMYDENN